MKRTYFHVFIPKKFVSAAADLDASAAADESAAVCFQGGGALSSIKHLNKNSEGEEEARLLLNITLYYLLIELTFNILHFSCGSSE